MTSAALILAVLSVAVPREAQRLPAVSRCYVIGAVMPGITNVIVSGIAASVWRTGAWATTVPVNPGTNVLEVFVPETGERLQRTVIVAEPKPKTSVAANASAPEKVWPKLEYARDTPRPAPVGRPPAEITIALDAGHGGATDLGAVSPHGIPEKDANLRTALAVAQELRSRGFRVMMTREEDVALALKERPRDAHRAEADAFVSIHHNAPPADGDPMTLRYHAVYAWNPIGERLAKAINRRMAEAMPYLTNNGVPHANYAVTRSPEIPSCLVEVDFITHPAGEEASWNPARRAAVAAAIADGISDWCGGPCSSR